ncbi:pre-rRNA processing protein Rrp12, putative [Rhizoctonia solani AG-1 IA]|uniref:Pre-rRNA processing protein Rrp12, putative n=1 Tax=Thanatephorus cucumeris (strain AG1-IA) TaxID=983506 RepID=L8WK00_THACA|nr:pre-rRNA processing protein Rrp12, putative [Rhizoctonia solani AG-1 IA]
MESRYLGEIDVKVPQRGLYSEACGDMHEPGLGHGKANGGAGVARPRSYDALVIDTFSHLPPWYDYRQGWPTHPRVPFASGCLRHMQCALRDRSPGLSGSPKAGAPEPEWKYKGASRGTEAGLTVMVGIANSWKMMDPICYMARHVMSILVTTNLGIHPTIPKMSSQLELALDKIRIHTSSKLLHQKTPATLLVALEQTFAEQTPPTPRSAVAYCAALCTTLEQAVKGGNVSMGEGDIVPGALYLLAAVLPYVPTPVLRSQVSVLLPLLAPLLPLSSQHPPALRSLLSVLCALWTPLDAPTLTGTPLVRNAWASVLQLCVDLRPKVRKRAQEVVRSVLAAPPAPMIRHPYAEQTAQYILKLLTDISPDHAEATIWSCAWKLVELLQALLTLPSLNIPFLTAAAYTTITAILTPPQTTLNPEAQDQATGSTIPPPTLPPTHFPASLATLLSLPPTGDADAAPWIGAVGACLYAWGEICRDPEAIEEAPSLSQDLLIAVPGAFRALWAQLEEGHSSEVRAAAEDAIVHGLLAGIFGDDGKVRSNSPEGGKAGGVPDLLVKECLKVWGKGPKNVKKTSLGLILTTLESSLDSVSAASSGALGNVLSVAEGVIDVLGTNSEVGGPTPATTLAPSLLTAVGTLRSAQDFMWREKADGVIGAAIRAMGPAAFLEVLPMNLIPDKNAYVGWTPFSVLIRSQVFVCSGPTMTVVHIYSRFWRPTWYHVLPKSDILSLTLSPFLRNCLNCRTGPKKRVNERWDLSVCIHQVWGCFRGYCTGLAGLKQGLSTPFLQLLTNLLYSQPTLRVSILHGIRALVASNRSIPADEIHYSYAERSCAEENLKFLAGLAGNMLSVLFNVFSSVESNDRGLVGEVISLWLGLADAKELSATFKKVSAMLSQNLKGAAATPLAHTALDLLVLLVPHLSPTDATKLFTIVFADNVISNVDGTVQKKAYRILARLIERGIVDGLQEGEGKNRKVESALARCAEITPSVNVSAKRDRVQLLSALVPLIPDGSLHIIPSLLPEAVLATKEVSEKTRNGAFDLVVAMGKRMERGGTVDRAKVDGMEVEQEGNEPTNVKANVEEYVTMVAAGLVGATPHMISATITTLSRLTFEFKGAHISYYLTNSMRTTDQTDILSLNMLSELITTVIVFVSSANREIVKSALGFAKVSVISLPTNIVTPHLDALVPALLGWSHDHKNHFKTKVLHIFERMGRRFGWESLEAAAGTHERAGIITHLRKKKERAPARTTTGDAFEDVLYGSDSDSSDADSETESKPSTAQKAKDRSNSDGKKQKSGMRIRLDNDEPMDLLHGSAARLTTGSAMSARRRQPGHEAAKFKTDTSTGRMVVEESSDEDEQDAGDDVAGAAYREMLTSTDGQTRDSSGKVRFAKDTKKRRALEREDADDDVEMADGTDAGLARESPKKKSKRNVIKVGGEFKAKNAGGDVKRQGQQDPYAYLPLGSLNKKKGRQGPRISITGRR